MQTQVLPTTDDRQPAPRTIWLGVAGQSWQVLSGSVDVFATRLDAGLPSGALYHLFRLGAGQALLGVGQAGAPHSVGLVARPSAGARLQPLANATLHARAELARWLEAWVGGVAAAIAYELAPKACVALARGGPQALKAGAAARAGSEVLWLQLETGQLALQGQVACTPNVALPLAGPAWVRAAEPTQLRPLCTEECLEAGLAWDGLAALHAAALAIIRAWIDRQAQADRARLDALAGGDRQAVGQALAQLAAILDAQQAAARPHTRGEAPLLAACQLVGDASGLTIHAAPPSAAQRAGRDPLAAIARASRVRVRRVALRANWWCSEHGPLLGFVEADQRPIALLPAARRGYLWHDPAADAPVAFVPADAARLEPFAYTFFRSFPDRALTAAEVLRFGLRGSARDLAGVLLTGAALGFLGLAVPIVTGVVFDSIVPAANQFKLLQLTLALVMAALATAAFQLVRSIAILRIETRMSSSIQAAVWDRLLNLPVPFFRQYSAGSLAAHVAGIDSIRQTLTGVTVSVLLTGLFALFNIGLMLAYDVRLGLIGAALVLVGAAVTFAAGYASLRSTHLLTAAQARVAGLVLQLIGGIARLRVAGAERRAFAVWAAQIAQQQRIGFRARVVSNGLAVFNAAFPTLALLVIFAAVASGSPAARSTGTVLAFVAAFSGLLAAAIGVSNSALGLLRIIPLFDNARPILATAPEIDPARADPGVLSGAIEVSHATFRYRPDGPAILQDVSFQAQPGEFIAIVGPSGSGKSTLLRLLLGFERPEAGSVYYDGQDLATLDLQAVRSQVGVVLQSSKLMPGDIYANIVGASLLTLDDAWQAAELAGLAADIRQMPMGMQTVIGEGGGTFSGGQRQRLMIARAIAARPRILLFDEATSALDNRTQAIVSASLERLQATRIVIAHRLSTIMNADRIYVIVAGRVVQQGSYAELADAPGPFQDLIRRQLV